MSKIDRFNTGVVRVVESRVKKALATLKDEMGLDFDISSIRYSPDQMTAQLKIGIVEEGAESVGQREWNKVCRYWNFEPEDFGRQFRLRGEIYTICGCKPSAPKYSILAKNARGMVYKFTPLGVKATLLPRKPAAPAPVVTTPPAESPSAGPTEPASSPNPTFGMF